MKNNQNITTRPASPRPHTSNDEPGEPVFVSSYEGLSNGGIATFSEYRDKVRDESATGRLES